MTSALTATPPSSSLDSVAHHQMLRDLLINQQRMTEKLERVERALEQLKQENTGLRAEVDFLKKMQADAGVIKELEKIETRNQMTRSLPENSDQVLNKWKDLVRKEDDGLDVPGQRNVTMSTVDATGSISVEDFQNILLLTKKKDGLDAVGKGSVPSDFGKSRVQLTESKVTREQKGVSWKEQPTNHSIQIQDDASRSSPNKSDTLDAKKDTKLLPVEKSTSKTESVDKGQIKTRADTPKSQSNSLTSSLISKSKSIIRSTIPVSVMGQMISFLDEKRTTSPPPLSLVGVTTWTLGTAVDWIRDKNIRSDDTAAHSLMYASSLNTVMGQNTSQLFSLPPTFLARAIALSFSSLPAVVTHQTFLKRILRKMWIMRGVSKNWLYAMGDAMRMLQLNCNVTNDSHLRWQRTSTSSRSIYLAIIPPPSSETIQVRFSNVQLELPYTETKWENKTQKFLPGKLPSGIQDSSSFIIVCKGPPKEWEEGRASAGFALAVTFEGRQIVFKGTHLSVNELGKPSRLVSQLGGGREIDINYTVSLGDEESQMIANKGWLEYEAKNKATLFNGAIRNIKSITRWALGSTITGVVDRFGPSESSLKAARVRHFMEWRKRERKN